MRRKDLKPALAITTAVVTLGFVLTTHVIATIRTATHRAYTEIASSCRRVSLVTVDGATYLCAPVTRVEYVSPAGPARTATPALPVAQL